MLAGCAAVESAGAPAVPFAAGRTDATQEQTDAVSFAVLEPAADAFRNYVNADKGVQYQYANVSPEALMIEKARMLNLSKPEMSVLVAGMRVLGANSAGSADGILTDNVGTLSNDFFVNLLSMTYEWKLTDAGAYECVKRGGSEAKWTASRVDLAFGSNSELRAIAEYYACDDAKDAFKADFAAAWGKVMALGM